jgi:hypothetical protein
MTEGLEALTRLVKVVMSYRPKPKEAAVRRHETTKIKREAKGKRR